MINARPGAVAARETVQHIFTADATRRQYLEGVLDESTVDPGVLTLDNVFLEIPGRIEAQTDLALDYHSNVALYPKWQEWLRASRLPTLVLWGRNNPFFVAAGAEAYKDDMPEAEPHVFDTGHFALEATAPDIIPIIADFLDRKIAAPRLKVAVVGGTGNLGGAVAEEARARGHEVAALNSADLDATDYEAVGKFSPGTTRS